MKILPKLCLAIICLGAVALFPQIAQAQELSLSFGEGGSITVTDARFANSALV